ncbi:MAG: pantoate--beta-alanine ligase [Candidatus Eisenbacteria bacterium]
MLKTIRRTDDLRRELAGARKRGRSIGFVPTMGYLHAGHLALVEECRRTCDVVVTSIFVNPKQFGPTEDLDRYPKDLRRDKGLLSRIGCDLLFVPSVREIYPPDFGTSIGVDDLRGKLCGETRPNHFDGVCVVVLKLLLAVMPDKAFFGEKDYQQLVIIKRMVRDLGLPVEIIGVPTVRDKDGLALSSRNAYLSEEERGVATSLFRSLELARLLVASGERRSHVIKDRIMSLLVDSGVTKVEYAAVIDPVTLDDIRYIDSEARIAVAALVGRARLIDNIAVDPRIGRGSQSRIKRGTVCVILAAGEGKRMKSERPKLLHEVGGVPMVEHVVRASRAAGVKDVFAIVGHKSEKLQPLMKKLRVGTVRQDVQRGTGHAVLQVYPLLAGFAGDILVLSGDVPLVRAATVKRLLTLHARHSNAITFATVCVPDARGYGRIVRNQKGSFVNIVEERDADREVRKIKEINVGLYCFKAGPLFDSLLTLTASNVQMEYYLPDSIQSIKSRGGRVEAVLIDDYTEGFGVNTAMELNSVRKIYSRRQRDEDNKRGLENGIHRKRR